MQAYTVEMKLQKAVIINDCKKRDNYPSFCFLYRVSRLPSCLGKFCNQTNEKILAF